MQEIASEAEAKERRQRRLEENRSDKERAQLLHCTELLFLLGRGLLFDSAADEPLLQVPTDSSPFGSTRPKILCTPCSHQRKLGLLCASEATGESRITLAMHVGEPADPCPKRNGPQRSCGNAIGYAQATMLSLCGEAPLPQLEGGTLHGRLQADHMMQIAEWFGANFTVADELPQVINDPFRVLLRHKSIQCDHLDSQS